MVDLQSQYQNIKSEIDTAIQEVIDSSGFINGKQVKEFAKNLADYTGSKYVIPCANGTDALQIALMALDLKPGDEIITTSFTFIATAEVISLLGLKPVFAEVNPKTFNIEPESIEKLITDKTKVILPVHLFGQCADMEKITEIAKRNNIYMIEDTAQAIGSDYYFKNGETKKAGTIGDIGCTSFFPSKNLGCFGDGGAIFTDNEELAAKIKQITNHGSKIKYYHDIVGVNSRLDTIQAAILDVKLRYLDKYIDARRKAADFYDNAFNEINGITPPYRSKDSKHVFHQYTLQVPMEKRDNLKEFLTENKIPAMVYYPVPMHLQNAYKYTGYKEGNLLVTENLSKTVLSLPMHTELENEQLEYITSKVVEFFS